MTSLNFWANKLAEALGANPSEDAIKAALHAVEAASEAGAVWTPLDSGELIDQIIAGNLKRDEPQVGNRDDGKGLFYRGVVNMCFGATSGAKTWLMLHCAVQEMKAGRHVVMFDLEDTHSGTLLRLVEDMAVDGETVKEFFHYYGPDSTFVGSETTVSQHIGYLEPSLIFIDSLGEALSVEGKNGNVDQEVAEWYRMLPRLLATAAKDAAVVVIDHTNLDAAAHRPGGSARKTQTIQGTSMEIIGQVEMGRGRAGWSKVVCRKDRNGFWPRGETVAEFHLDSSGDDGIARAELRSPGPEVSKEDADKLRAVLHATWMVEVLEAAGEPLSGAEVFRRLEAEGRPVATNYRTAAKTALLEAGRVEGIGSGPQSKLRLVPVPD